MLHSVVAYLSEGGLAPVVADRIDSFCVLALWVIGHSGCFW